LENIDSFTEELFQHSDDISILGTATGEIFFGLDEVKQLIKDDWEGWGDLNIDYENAYISIVGNTAWFSTNETVKYSFEHIKEFFINSDMGNLSLDIENTIASKSGKVTWITVIGILKQNFIEDELINRSLEELDNLFKSDISSQEKLFAAQRSISYVLKECASGVNYTCPIRMTAVISNNENGLKFNNIHFSFPFPFYWIFEGKIDMNLKK